MTNGVLACSYGRPGNRIMFSVDGTGRQWTDRLKVYEYPRGSFGYTGIVEVAPGQLLFVYDRRDAFPECGGRHTTAHGHRPRPPRSDLAQRSSACLSDAYTCIPGTFVLHSGVSLSSH